MAFFYELGCDLDLVVIELLDEEEPDASVPSSISKDIAEEDISSR